MDWSVRMREKGVGWVWRKDLRVVRRGRRKSSEGLVGENGRVRGLGRGV